MTDLGEALLGHLRTELGAPGVTYADPPAPMSGGYDTSICGFRLSGAPATFAIPLILRVLGPHHPPARALSERATQNAVADLGYPAPRVLLASADPTILGGAFLVMERLAGRRACSPRAISRRTGAGTRWTPPGSPITKPSRACAGSCGPRRPARRRGREPA